MSTWVPSDVPEEKMDEFVANSLLYPHTDAIWWCMPGAQRQLVIPNSAPYIVSNWRFLEGGFCLPVHVFFHGLLFYYDLELQHFNPNEVL